MITMTHSRDWNSALYQFALRRRRRARRRTDGPRPAGHHPPLHPAHRGSVASSFGRGDADELPARGALGARARRAVESGLIDVVTGFRVERVTRGDTGVVLVAQDGRVLPAADRVIVLTGFRPDLSFLSEMRLELDTTLQAPIMLAPLIDPNLHSCGSVYPHGAGELSHPEPDLYLVGMKSYGRAPTFLAMTGYEQVRSVVAQLAGDDEAAARVELTLPETGVCGGAGLFDEDEAEAAGAPFWWRDGRPRRPPAEGGGTTPAAAGWASPVARSTMGATHFVERINLMVEKLDVVVIPPGRMP
jgi:hypothetical protein